MLLINNLGSIYVIFKLWFFVSKFSRFRFRFHSKKFRDSDSDSAQNLAIPPIPESIPIPIPHHCLEWFKTYFKTKISILKIFFQVQKFVFQKEFFWPKIFKNLCFWPCSTKNSRNLVSLAQNDRNTILMKWVKKIFKNFSPKIKKSIVWPKMTKNGPKHRKYFRIFFDRNRFRMLQNVF